MNTRLLPLLLLLSIAHPLVAQEPTTLPATAPATLPATTEPATISPATEPATLPTTEPAPTITTPQATRSPTALVEIVRAKSIFSKDRQPPRRWNDSPSRPSWQSSQPSAPRLPILIGVARAETDLVAVIELPDERRVIQLRPGDQLPNDAGVLERITLDQIEIASTPGATTRPIKVGQDLGGALAQPTTAPSTNVSDSPAGPAGSMDGDDPLSRMRRRRMQEMNR